MRELASRINYDASNLTALIDRLHSRGLIERRPDDTDRRVKSLSLTSAGESLRNRFWTDLVATPGPLEPLSREEIETLIGIMSKIAPPDGR